VSSAGGADGSGLAVDLRDDFWAPRVAQLRDHTLPVMLERLERQGAIDAFRRLGGAQPRAERRALWFSDSDVYKWMEAAAWAGRSDLLDPVIELVQAAARPDGYLHTFYDVGPGSPPRYGDLATSHEFYCAGHLVEAALAHHAVTGDDALLTIARRWADHQCDTFGPGRDERVDGHPEAELALARLAHHTGEERYLDQARWLVERQLTVAGRSIDDVDLAGHAVKVLYLATGIAEIAAATEDIRWMEATERLFATLVEQRSYPTGAVGGRWIDESVGKPFELPDAMAYAESCAAVASVRFCRRVWDLTADPRALDQIELLLYNAVPCGVGADGESWFYSQPQAVPDVAPESNPWVTPFEYGPSMLLSWFPARRHRWFDVACCPPNLGRMFATVHHHVAEVAPSGDLTIHLPLAARLTGAGWDVEVASVHPEPGAVTVTVHEQPGSAELNLRIPGWAGGTGHRSLPPDGRVDLTTPPAWWETDRRVEGAAGTVFLRHGPVVHCVEGLDAPGTDLRELVVDPTQPPAVAFSRVAPGGSLPLHRPAGPRPGAEPAPDIATVPYHSWANRGLTTMRVRFPRR